MQIIGYFLPIILIYGSAKKSNEKRKVKRKRKTLAELNSAHPRSHAKSQLVQIANKIVLAWFINRT